MSRKCDVHGTVDEGVMVFDYRGRAKICEECVIDMFTVMEKNVTDAIKSLEDKELEALSASLAKNSRPDTQEDSKVPSVDDIIGHLNKTIVGQDKAKETVAIAIRNHFKRMILPAEKQKMVEKSNILLMGPSGSGKSAMLKAVAEFVDVPLVIVDSSIYTTAGYVGSDVEEIINELYEKAGKDKALTECGIVFLDEIDKKKKSRESSGRVEPGGEQAQQAFLKLVEGKEVQVDKKTTIDTSNILFIAGGAFVGIPEIVERRMKKRNFGFLSEGASTEQRDVAAYEAVATEDLIEFGMIPEFIGRFPVTTYTKELTKDEITHIIKHTDNSILKQYKELLYVVDGLELEVTAPAIETISELVIRDKIGVRGIRKVFEQVLHNVQRNAETIRKDGGCKVQINKAVVLDDALPVIVRNDGGKLHAKKYYTVAKMDKPSL